MSHSAVADTIDTPQATALVHEAPASFLIRVQRERKKKKAALAELEKSDFQPTEDYNLKLSKAVFEFGQLYYMMGPDHEGTSQQLIEKSLHYDPLSVSANLLLMDIHSRKGEFSQALDVFTNPAFQNELSDCQTRHVAHSFIKLNLHRGVRHEAEGRPGAAKKYYAKANDLVKLYCPRASESPNDNAIRIVTLAALRKFDDTPKLFKYIPTDWRSGVREQVGDIVIAARFDRPNFLRQFRNLAF